MNCQEARQLIDRYLDSPERKGTSEWNRLEAHLASCAACAADFRQLEKTRELLADLPEITPTEKEKEMMLSVIQAAPIENSTSRITERLAGKWRVAGAFTAVAACLVIAFILGESKYNQFRNFVPRQPQVAAVEEEIAGGYSAGYEFDNSNLLGDSQLAEVSRGTPQTQWMDADRGINAKSSSVTRRSNSSKGVRGTIVENLTSESRGDLSFGLPLADSGVEGDLNITTGEQFTAGGRYAVDNSDTGYDLFFGRAGTTITERLDSNDYVAKGYADDVSFDKSAAKGVKIVVAGDDLSSESPINKQKIAEVDYSDYAANDINDSFVFRGDEANRGFAVLGDWVSPAGKEKYGYFAAGEKKVERFESSASTTTRTVESPALKIIKTGNIVLEVDSYKAAFEQAMRVVDQFGATIADGSTREESGGALSGRVVIRVLPERFEELFNALKQIGRVQSENAKAADVTAEYVDTSARIKSLQITETRLRELIKNKSFVDGMKALLEVEREMNRVRTEIEQLQGNLRVMSDRIAYSTITLDINEPKRIVPSADLAVGIWDLEDTVKEMDTLLEAVDGQLASGNISKSDNGTLKGNYLLKVKLSQFGKTIESISELGRVDKKVVKDWQAKDAGRDWANRVICNISLVLQESVGQLPSGSINIEVPDVRPAIESLTDLLGKHRGSIAENNISKREDGSEVALVRLQIPAGDFSEVVKNLDQLGRITGKTISGDAGEIRGGAANTLCGLYLKASEPFRQLPAGHIVILAEDYKKSLEALGGIIKKNELDVLGTSSNQSSDGTWKGQFRLGIKAADIDAIIKQLLEIGPVTSQQLQGVGLGNLSRVDTNAVAALDLVIAQKQAITPGPERTGGSVRQWLHDGLSALYTSVGLITYGLVVIAPWLILTIIITWLLAKLLRRRKNRKTADTKA